MMVAEVTTESFVETVATGVTLVDFWAPWCGPCRALAPILDEVSTALEGKVKVVKVNTDENIALAQQYGVSSIPFLVVFKDGQKVDQAVGVKQKAELIAMLEKQM